MCFKLFNHQTLALKSKIPKGCAIVSGHVCKIDLSSEHSDLHLLKNSKIVH